MVKLFRGRLRWVLIFWMFLMGAISFLDRVNISIAGQAVQSDFNISNVQLGYVFSAFVIGYALFQVPGGRLADRFGPRRVITIGVLWWSLFTTFTALVPTGLGISLWMLAGVRFLLGIGEAVVYPASNRLVANWIPTTERGTANGFIFAGVGAGAGITPPLITYILVNWGWHWSFYISAVIGAVAGGAWYLLARDTPWEHPWINKKEIAHIEAGLPAPAEVLGAHKVAPWGAVLRNRSIGFLALSYFTYGYSAFIFFSWFFIYLSRVRGLDLKASSFYSMLPFLAMATCSPLGGWTADVVTRRYGRRAGRCGIGVLGLAGAAVLIALATQVESARIASIFLACGVGSLYLAQSSYWAVTADIAGASAGSVSGLMNMGGQIGGALTATLTPMIADSFGWTASFLTAAGLCAIGSIAWLFVNPNVQLGRD
jgi:ACS family glucarate transporter-like MFS transporter